MPPVLVPLGVASIISFGLGLSKLREPQAKTPPLTLPLRQTFEIAANDNLSRLLERHMAMLGYSVANRSDLLWSFVRGAWSAQFWQSDIRQWRTQFNVAAYELDSGGYRISCYVNLERAFNDPDRKMLAVLEEEMHDLKELFGGRDVPSRELVGRAS
jgi:hypothetical protein